MYFSFDELEVCLVWKEPEINIFRILTRSDIVHVSLLTNYRLKYI